MNPQLDLARINCDWLLRTAARLDQLAAEQRPPQPMSDPGFIADVMASDNEQAKALLRHLNLDTPEKGDERAEVVPGWTVEEILEREG